MKLRIIAKIIDTMFVSVILAVPVSSYLFAIYAIEIAYNSKVSLVAYIPLLIIIFFTLYIYFGIVGKKSNGSVAKGFMGLEITGPKINSFKLFIREPLTQVFLLAVLYRLVFSSIITSLLLISLIYFVALILRVDLWNKIFKNEVVQKGEK